ncbi:hypothetical protein AN220_00545 [Streptomyces nanshensis]|nr:hypothetical protein AN220_00545 [Streptomyces nanshensis]
MSSAFGGFQRLQGTDTDPDFLAETAGRACYRSFNRPNPDTRHNYDYLNNVISKGHESVLAHASVTFAIRGVSRNLTHEMIRSRFLAFSELSQRYVEPDDAYTVVPPALVAAGVTDFGALDENSKNNYALLKMTLENAGLSKKQIREAARAVLPGGTETEIIVSGNIRAWRDFIKQRLSPMADAEIQALAYAILENLIVYCPNSVQDLAYLADEYVDRINE